MVPTSAPIIRPSPHLANIVLGIIRFNQGRLYANELISISTNLNKIFCRIFSKKKNDKIDEMLSRFSMELIKLNSVSRDLHRPIRTL